MRLFEDQEARCPKNPKRWWIFRWLGPHRLKLLVVRRFGPPDWHEWEVELECRTCGARFHRFGFGDTTIIAAGLDLEAIRDACNRSHWGEYRPDERAGQEQEVGDGQ